MPRIKDIIGQVFGRLTVISLCKDRSSGGSALWLCKCDCGNTPIVSSPRLTGGRTRSCGCLRKETPNRLKHGKSLSKEYLVWKSMKTRCLNKNDYDGYLARGIMIDPLWVNSFEQFYTDMGTCPDGMSIDRIDNNGDYEPSNCRWADSLTQNNNTRKNMFVTYGGATLTYSQWSRRLGGANNLVASRKWRGWSDERAVSTPAKRNHHRPLCVKQ